MIVEFLVLAALLGLIVVLFMALGTALRDGGPPATRRELARAERENRADITPALTSQPIPVVLVVRVPSQHDDPRRWN